MLKRINKNRVEGSNNNDNSDFGSSEGTNIHFNFPSTIHEMISPGGTNSTNTKQRHSAVQQTTKNYRYIGAKKDSLQDDSRNEMSFF